MLPLLARFVFALILIAGSIGSVQAAKLTDKQVKEQQLFAANNTLFVLYHEVAHLLVHQLGLPVLGREEDAADNMATWTLLNKHTRAADLALADAAYGWLLSGLKYGKTLDDSDYYDVHSLDRQRAFQIVCLMVGADSRKFGTVADQYKMDSGRQEECYWDHQTVDRSFRAVLARYMKKGTGSNIAITYHAASGTLKAAADAFKSSGVFEDVAQELRTSYSLRSKINFRAKRCGEANAFYDPETIEIIFCYELMQDFMQLYAEDMKEPAIPVSETGIGRSGSATPGT